VAANDINITGANVAQAAICDGRGQQHQHCRQPDNRQQQPVGLLGQKRHSFVVIPRQGSSITAGGNAMMQAGNDLNVTASAIDAGKTAQLVAGNDLNLNAADNGQTSRTGGSESHQSSADRTTFPRATT
jgi:filamentous hemagglutinin